MSNYEDEDDYYENDEDDSDEDIDQDDTQDLMQNIQVDLDEETAQGIYSNLTISTFSSEEFVLDFAFLQPSMGKGKIRSRIILNPRNVKRLTRMLAANVEEYENKFGLISEDDNLPGIRLSFN